MSQLRIDATLTVRHQIPGESVRRSGCSQRGALLRAGRPMDPSSFYRARYKPVCHRGQL